MRFRLIPFSLMFSSVAHSFLPYNRVNPIKLVRQSLSTAIDTVFSVSSGPVVKSGICVIRLSGPLSKHCLEELSLSPVPAPRYASLRKLRCPKTKDVLDSSLVLWFPGPKSFTGEDCVELHVHGSRAVVSGIFSSLSHIGSECSATGRGSIRPAERGEFTRRAFENGKMDLTEVEGLADLLEADTSEQRKQALRQLEGHLRVRLEHWRDELIHCLAHTEAVIDFGDDDRENDIDDSTMYSLAPRVQALRNTIAGHLQDNRRGEIVREGIRIVLAGPPNSGKSSLLNALARRSAAIVSPTAGTTRDVVEVRMDLNGVSCIFSDTAGLREDSTDPIEIEGINRARSALQSAHIVLFLSDCSNESSHEAAVDVFNTAQSLLSNTSTRIYFIRNKIDLLNVVSLPAVPVRTSSTHAFSVHDMSCASGTGLADLEKNLTATVTDILSSSSSESNGELGVEGVLITRERHRHHLNECISHLDRFLSTTLPMDAAAEELRLALMDLGRITGRVDVEELLDVIFRDFCIGK